MFLVLLLPLFLCFLKYDFFMSYLRYLLLEHSGLFFALLFFVLCLAMLPVFLDCPYLAAPSVFSNVYLQDS